MKRGFLSNIAYTNALWGAGLLLLMAAAVINHIVQGHVDMNGGAESFNLINQYTFLNFSLYDTLKFPFLYHLLQFLFLLGTALLLQYMSSEFRLIRVRSYFTFFLFCLLGGTLLPNLTLSGATASCFLFILAIFRLFRSLDHGFENRAVFDTAVLLTLSSIFQSRMLWLVPAIWMVMGILQVFSLKSFLASLLGILSVFWIIGGVSFLIGDYSYLLAYSKDLLQFQLFPIYGVTSTEISYIAYLAVLMISAIISFWPKQHLDKLRTRNYLNSVLLLWFAMLILWFFSSNDESYMLPLLGLSALVMAHFFSLVDSLYSRLMFFALLILSVTAFLYY
ncbi:MAG TPA: hypothetical protein VFP20_03500 [Bacteroidales bacterium]|nr:hypothetical protein [Bacteroidales bacterium]